MSLYNCYNLVLGIVLKIQDDSIMNRPLLKACKDCRFVRIDCSNKYRAQWKDKYKCSNCIYYTATNEKHGTCELNNNAYKEWCYSGCSRYKD